jgi:hypothetical protein
MRKLAEEGVVMPVPAGITSMGAAAYNCGTTVLTFNNPRPHVGGQRPTLTRNFIVYLELAMQAKHDAKIQGYCRSIHVAPRTTDGTQVTYAGPAATALAPGGFYRTRAATAANVVKNQMVTRWQGGTTFVPGTRVDASVQAHVQADGYRYEVSYWYDGNDIYVLFHTYP